MSVHSLAFNRDTSLLTCGTDNGVTVYKLNPVQKHLTIDKNGGVGIVKILDKTNFSVIVGGGENPYKSTDRVCLWNDAENKNSLELDMKKTVKNVLITRDSVVVVLERELCIFNYYGHILFNRDTFCNDTGLCVVNSDNECMIVATLGTTKGSIAVYKPNADICCTINAHSNNIEAVTLNYNGSLVATASEIGTNIHVYDSVTGELMYKFKRGAFSSKIHSLCFSVDSDVLSCCSSTGTVHIFEMYKDKNTTKNTRSVLSNIIPNSLGTTYFDSYWSFTQIDLENGSKMVSSFDNRGVLHIASYDGYYYRISGKDYSVVTKSTISV